MIKLKELEEMDLINVILRYNIHINNSKVDYCLEKDRFTRYEKDYTYKQLIKKFGGFVIFEYNHKKKHTEFFKPRES